MSGSLEEAVAAALKSRQDKQYQADMELIGHLDWESRLPCAVYYRRANDSGRIPCDRAADWRMICRGCGFLALTCGPCRDKFLTSTEQKVCAICRQRATVVTGWFFEPLRAIS